MLRRALPLLLLVAATLTACDDPSNVGLGLVGDDSGQPEIVRTPAQSVIPSARRDLGGGTDLLLAGQVSDPLLGDIEAAGYVDFGTVTPVGAGSLSRFRSGSVQHVYLQMPRSYVYGDTLSDVSIDLRTLSSEFSPTDSTFSVGNSVASFTYALPDSSIRVNLPDAWVAANDTTLRSLVFATSFHGFQLAATGGNAVIGFDPDFVRLYAITAQDTVYFSVGKLVSGAKRLSAPSLPEGYVLLQDGVAADLTAYPEAAPRFRVGLFDTAQVSRIGVSRLALEMVTDTVLIRQTPPNFVRPRLGSLELVAADANEGILLSGTSFYMRATATASASGRITFATSGLTAVGQLHVLGREMPARTLLLQAPQNLGTLNALLLRAPGAEDAPTYVLTVVPTD